MKFANKLSLWRFPQHLFVWVLIALTLYYSTPASVVYAATESKIKHVPRRAPEAKTAKRNPNKKNRPNFSLQRRPFSLSPTPTDAQIFSARVFSEPLVPMKIKPVAGENPAISSALRKFVARADREDVSDLIEFLNSFPKSRWHASLELEVGTLRYDTGYISQALQHWETSWKESKNETSVMQKAVADKAFGELTIAKARVGQIDQLGKSIAEAGDRKFAGSAAERVKNAKMGLGRMTDAGDCSFRCGPLAINNLLYLGQKNKGLNPVIRNVKTPKQGTNLAQICDLASKVGLHYQMAKRKAGAVILTPAVYHWRVGHFAAITGVKNGKYELKDPTFDYKSRMLLSAKALDSETDGYFLVPAGPLPSGWSTVSRAEGEKVWGRGDAIGIGGNETGCHGITCFQCRTPMDCYGHGGLWLHFLEFLGMAQCNANKCQATLKIFDTPLQYSYSLGSMPFSASYENNSTNQPVVYNFTNLGQDWRFNYCGWIDYTTETEATLLLRTGGSEVYEIESGIASSPNLMSQATLLLLPDGGFQRNLPDGSYELYNSESAGYYFLTQIVDQQGNITDINYDSSSRIVSIDDSLGQTSLIAYASTDSMDPGYYKIATISDPYGRSATFGYDSTNSDLLIITDAVGMQSSFRYLAGTSFINLMSTEYGTTSFYAYNPSGGADSVGLRTTYPDGSAEVVETWVYAKSTYYWNREQLAAYPNDPGNQVHSHCEVTSWLMPSLTAGLNVIIPVAASVQQPLESSVTYSYPDQPSSDLTGSVNEPSGVSQYTVAGTQTYQYSYNLLGKVTQSIDPVGRTFSYSYATNNIDLLEKRETKGTDNYLMGHWEYNSQHAPTLYIDGSAQQTHFYYNSVGQPTSVVDADSNTINLTYDSDYYLQTVDGPLAGSDDVTIYSWDSAGRLASKIDSLGYELDFYYDNLNRNVKVLYPDGSTNLTTWSRLDPVVQQDRLGRITQSYFDNMDQVVKQVDPLGRITKYMWCICGGIKTLTDGNGNVTTWNYDLEGRPIEKIFADSSHVDLTYDPYAGWLYSQTDALSQIKYYSYFLDNLVSEISYSNSVVSTSNRFFTYDPTFSRLLTAQNGWGSKTYSYNDYVTDPFGVKITGGGKLASISNNVLSNSTISFGYDELGRLTNRSVNNSSNSETLSFDAASRILATVNNLGTLGVAYQNSDSGSLQVSSIAYPNSQTSNFNWYSDENPTEFERLQSIQNLSVNSTNLSSYAYQYKTDGAISVWDQTVLTGSTNSIAVVSDLCNQIVNADSSTTSFSFSYDQSANRISIVDSGVTTTSTMNNLNQVTGLTGGTSTALSYDLNGNMISDGTLSYSYDAENRLVKIVYPGGSGTQSVFSYDAFGARVGIVESEGGATTSTKQFVTLNGVPVEERGADGTVTKQFYASGEIIGSAKYFYTKDHLGSVRDVTDSDGNIQGHYEYGMYGEVTQTVGTLASDFQYAGYYYHAPSGLNLTTYRAYNPTLGRWINRDPIEEEGGTNLYQYCLNEPISFFDPLGLDGNGAGIAAAAIDLATNHPTDFNNNRAKNYYTCAIFVNAAVKKAGAPPIVYPAGANPGNVSSLGSALGSSPGYSPVPTAGYTAEPGDIVIFPSHSGIATTGGTDPTITYGGASSGNVGSTPLSILKDNPWYAGQPKKIFRCCPSSGSKK